MIEGVSSGACQGLWEPEEVCTWLELHHAGMVNGDSSEHPRLGDLGSDKTLSECHNVD